MKSKGEVTSMGLDPATTGTRLRVVEDHIRFECAHDLGSLMDTFGADPEWHNQAGEQVLRGYEPIHGFYHDLFAGFPDFRIDVSERYVADGAVMVEGVLCGTQNGAWMGIPPTGKSVAVPFSAVFTFTTDNRVKKEIVYWDRMTLLGQLGVLGAVAGA
jgi:steroid delta-isomerase-like uncharacterized protein